MPKYGWKVLETHHKRLIETLCFVCLFYFVNFIIRRLCSPFFPLFFSIVKAIAVDVLTTETSIFLPAESCKMTFHNNSIISVGPHRRLFLEAGFFFLFFSFFLFFLHFFHVARLLCTVIVFSCFWCIPVRASQRHLLAWHIHCCFFSCFALILLDAYRKLIWSKIGKLMVLVAVCAMTVPSQNASCETPTIQIHFSTFLC